MGRGIGWRGQLGLLVWALALLGLPGSSAAEERAWVRGEVRLNVRSGPGNQYKIFGSIKTGDPVTVLNRGKRWTEVQTDSGIAGFVPAGYLDPVPPPKIQLEHFEAEVKQLREQASSSEAEASELRGSQSKLVASEQEARSRAETLERENLRLKAGTRWQEWITGALILSTGMVLGAILSRVSARGRRQRIKL